MKKNIIIIVSIIVIAVVARYANSMYGQIMQGKMMAAGNVPSVMVGHVSEAQVIKQIEAPGRIVSKYQVNVMARISGYLTKTFFKEGDDVKKGQTLFEIEPDEYKFSMQKAKAQVDNTRAQLVYAEKQLIRSAELVKKDYIAKSAYDSTLSQRDALRASLALTEAAYRDAQRNYGYTRVKAPVDGRVGIIAVTVGNYVSTAGGALTTINSANPIYVSFPLDSKDFVELTKADNVDNTNRKVELFLPNGEKYEYSGVQDFHDNKVDESTGTITMRATFQNPKGDLVHGEFVKVFVYSNQPVNVPVVPQTAVLENPQGKYVYKVDEKNLPQIVFIQTSGQYKDNWIIKEGVKKGDKIIVDGLQKVVPGNPIKIVDKTAMDKIKQEIAEEEVPASAKTDK